MDLFWEKQDWEKEDLHLKRLEEAPFRRPFPRLEPSQGTTVIRGPRQIGKTSWLKSILSEQLNRGRRCFYASCERQKDFRDLAELLRGLRQYDIVLLDEISFVDEWARAVKAEADTGKMPILVVTGSNALDLRRGSERLPGRMSVDGELCLLPMDFDEFVAMRRQAEWRDLSRLEHLELYFRVGGFPAALIEAGEEGKRPVVMEDTLRRWIVGDVLRAGRQEMYLREILGQLAQTMTTPLSLQKLAQRTQLGSHHTAQDYISVLEDCFVLRTMFAIDPNDGALRFRKEKKFYFTDPLIYRLAIDWSGLPHDADEESKIAEAAAAEALCRRYARLGYYSSPRGEVDFYVHNQWALEVKWRPAVRDLSVAFHRLMVPKKIVWTKENFFNEWP